ncbi:MAG: cbb3-type cytochrome oxidase assembly protein CcoS [Pseudomonadota bacterium]
MDILFLLVPISVLLALGVVGVLAWAVWSGQFEELESEGLRIFMEDRVEPGLPNPDAEA